MCYQPKLGYNLLGNKYNKGNNKYNNKDNNTCNKLVKERKMRKNGFLIFMSNSEKEEKMCFVFMSHSEGV